MPFLYVDYFFSEKFKQKIKEHKILEDIFEENIT